jgi:chorismate dehydratase
VQVPDSLRLGCVGYLNARPLIHGWGGPVRLDHPSVLCRMLAAGELDVALVSSFEYLRNPIYSVVDNVAIASDGPVYSVVLVHQGPPEDLREVVVDPASETSVNLLRCLLGGRRSPVIPEFVREGEITPNRGRLFIGDQAIRLRAEVKDRFQILDLGAAWQRQIGLPFVYALWLIHPDFPEKQTVASALRSLAARNLAKLDAVIAAQAPAVDRAFCEFYYRECLRFGFGELEKIGFKKFGELCAKEKILPAAPPAPELV